jgi:RNA polymerase sigma factor (sigma-70 family)
MQRQVLMVEPTEAVAPTQASMSDGELLLLIRQGDEGAWRELVERHTPRLWSIARVYGLDRTRSEDIVQTCWLRLLDYRDRIREPESIGGWLRQTARHEALRVLQIARRTSGDELVAPADPTTERRLEEVEQHDEVGWLTGAFERLSARCQRYLRLLFHDDLSYREIAQLVGQPIGSIGPTRQRCLRELRQHYDVVSGGTQEGSS